MISFMWYCIFHHYTSSGNIIQHKRGKYDISCLYLLNQLYRTFVLIAIGLFYHIIAFKKALRHSRMPFKEFLFYPACSQGLPGCAAYLHPIILHMLTPAKLIPVDQYGDSCLRAVAAIHGKLWQPGG